jgi:hypothetical protein
VLAGLEVLAPRQAVVVDDEQEMDDSSGADEDAGERGRQDGVVQLELQGGLP